MEVQFNPSLLDESLWTEGNAAQKEKLLHLPRFNERRPIYIFDMDGTIANSYHRHHYLQSIDGDGNIVPRAGGKDWDAFFEAQKDDIVFPAVAGIMEALICNLNVVLILTARPEDQRGETVRWLHEWSVPYDAMFMRPEGNRTDDNELKPAQIHTYLEGHTRHVRTIFEDRRRLVHSLRHHGFHVCHVAEGDF